MKKKLKLLFDRADKDMGYDDRSEEIYCITALFDTPNDIIIAAAEVSKLGYTEFDVHTPYPIHGMDDAMNLKPTKLGFFTFFFGALGTLSALLMIGYLSGIDYKNVIGGKPFFALPPAMPITFELTVLFSAAAVIALMMVMFNKLPELQHPLMDTEYMKRASSDKFGIIIKATDPMFNTDEIRDLFKEIGSKTIGFVHQFKNADYRTKTPIFTGRFVTLLFGIFAVVVLFTYLTLNQLIFMTPFDWMNKQPRLMPQAYSSLFKDGRSMQTPVEGTVARNFIPYEFKDMQDSAVKNISNPLPYSEEVLKTGKARFNTYCSPCHGYFGKGDSRLRGLFPNPPSLHTDKVRNWQDANIYHVITNGQNIMPSYAKQISRDDRWAVIHYLRALQRSQNATDADLNIK